MNILVIDDDMTDRMAVKRALQQIDKNITVVEADNGQQALEIMKENAFDCVFLDYLLPDIDGIGILKKVYNPRVGLTPFPIVVCTGQGNESVMLEAFQYGVQDYLVKNNISSDTLNIALIKSREFFETKRSLIKTKHELEKKVEIRTYELEKAKAEAEIIAQIPEAHSNPIMRVSQGGRLIYSNKAALKQFPDLKTKGFNHFIMEGVDSLVIQLKDQKANIDIQEIAVSNDIFYLRTVMPIYTKDAKSLAIFIQDVSDIKKAQAEAERANQAKDDFLANMSHELRTPMNSIIGLTKILMEEEGLDDEQRETLRVIDKAAVSLLDIVNDILDLSKIEAGRIDLEQLPFNVIGLMHSLIEQTKPLASQKGVSFNTNIKDFSSVNIIGDEFRLSRILVNLISNAIKYTLEGHVTVSVSIKEQGNGSIEFICAIQDTGIGISEDKMDSVFEKFTQAEESTARRFGGTGLGLSITKQLTELMGGEIAIQSEFGKGSIFTVRIPFKQADENTILKNKRQQKSALIKTDIARKPIEMANILIAEDHELNQIFVLKLLKRMGSENFKLVTDGKEAIRAFKTDAYDLVLMDCHMPEMNGYDAVKEIRTEEKNRKVSHNVPIIAMTADAMPGTREGCLEAGMDEYISKPIDEGAFRLLIQNWFELPEEQKKTISRRSQQECGQEPANLNILREYANNDLETEKELILIFYQKSLDDLKAMEAHTTKDNYAAWSDAAHGLKGSAGYVGAARLQTLCEQAQNCDSDSVEERESLLNEIKEEHNRVCDYLRKQGVLEAD